MAWFQFPLVFFWARAGTEHALRTVPWHKGSSLRLFLQFYFDLSYLSWVDESLPSLFAGTKLMEGPAEKLNCGTADSYGDAEYVPYSGDYGLGQIHSLLPHIRRGKEIIRRATAAVLAKNTVGTLKR